MKNDLTDFFEISETPLKDDVVAEVRTFNFGFHFRKVTRKILKGRGKKKYSAFETKYYCIDENIPDSLKTKGFKSPFSFKCVCEAMKKYGSELNKRYNE